MGLRMSSAGAGGMLCLLLAITLFSMVTAAPVVIEGKAGHANLFETTKVAEKSTEVEVAWGPTGHETTAALAMMLVQPATAACVETLVSDLAESAVWADVCKKTPAYHWSGALHYIGTPA